MLKNTFSSFQRCRWQHGSIRLAVVDSEIPQNFPKIRTYSSSKSPKVVDLGVNRQLICKFLWVINSNYGHICYRFQDIDAFSSKIVINVIYTRLRNTFYGLQFRRWHYGSIYLHSFSCCCLPKSRNHAKFRQNWTLQQMKAIQGQRFLYQSKAHMRLPISH